MWFDKAVATSHFSSTYIRHQIKCCLRINKPSWCFSFSSNKWSPAENFHHVVQLWIRKKKLFYFKLKIMTQFIVSTKRQSEYNAHAAAALQTLNNEAASVWQQSGRIYWDSGLNDTAEKPITIVKFHIILISIIIDHVGCDWQLVVRSKGWERLR